MNTIIVDIFLVLVFLILFSVLILLFMWMWNSMTAKVPFVSIPNKTLKDIEKALNLSETSAVYDLGCGDGRVLFYLYKKNPKAFYVGIENSFFPYLLATVTNWWHRKIHNSNIIILRKDFFDFDLSKATHIFTYLHPNIMDDLLPKFDKELKRGARLVSAYFHFTLKREIGDIELKHGQYQPIKKLYVYEF